MGIDSQEIFKKITHFYVVIEDLVSPLYEYLKQNYVVVNNEKYIISLIQYDELKVIVYEEKV
jgi:hypothetical protein